jgi:hypothetical protein
VTVEVPAAQCQRSAHTRGGVGGSRGSAFNHLRWGSCCARMSALPAREQQRHLLAAAAAMAARPDGAVAGRARWPAQPRTRRQRAPVCQAHPGRRLPAAAPHVRPQPLWRPSARASMLPLWHLSHPSQRHLRRRPADAPYPRHHCGVRPPAPLLRAQATVLSAPPNPRRCFESGASPQRHAQTQMPCRRRAALARSAWPAPIVVA